VDGSPVPMEQARAEYGFQHDLCYETQGQTPSKYRSGRPKVLLPTVLQPSKAAGPASFSQVGLVLP
jgi:hypothetical protein